MTDNSAAAKCCFSVSLQKEGCSPLLSMSLPENRFVSPFSLSLPKFSLLSLTEEPDYGVEEMSSGLGPQVTDKTPDWQKPQVRPSFQPLQSLQRPHREQVDRAKWNLLRKKLFSWCLMWDHAAKKSLWIFIWIFKLIPFSCAHAFCVSAFCRVSSVLYWCQCTERVGFTLRITKTKVWYILHEHSHPITSEESSWGMETMLCDHTWLNYIAPIPTLPDFKIWNIHVSNRNTIKGSGLRRDWQRTLNYK